MLHCPKEIYEASAKAIDGPNHYDVEFPAASVIEHGIEARTLLTVLGTRDAVVVIDVDDVPTTALCYLPERKHLVLCRLIVGGNASVDRDALHLGYPLSGCGSLILPPARTLFYSFR